ncbi:MAG TPA: N-acetylmuramoyl-L-alanine amidase [Gemmatimonadaceae bacterium]|jgi:N-acetylmuramoyl-L-alanine amidase|nr:N-acetylmuramoyl-L-alanine amidase [Gemmatimonadaceae bacterium]
MRIRIVAPTVLAAIIAACHSTPAPPAPPPVAPKPTPPVSPPTVPTFERGISPRQAPPLPAIPLVEGPLAPRLVYPGNNETISVRDSNFIFGSVGNGHATLTINGAPVPVAPNGTFLAYLPVPPPTTPQFELVARTATDSARVIVPVRVPPARPDLSLTGRLVVDSASASPRGTGSNVALRDSEPVRVSIRAPSNANAWVVAGGATTRLVNVGSNGSTLFATDLPAAALRKGGTLYAARDRDTVRFSLSSVDPAPKRGTLVSLGDAAAQSDTDAYIIGRSTPQGTYKWMFVPGTIVEATGASGDNLRVRLDNRLEAWVDSSSVRPLPPAYPVPRRVVGPITLVPAADWVDVTLPVASPPPYLIEQELNRITLTLYGTQATPDIIKFLGNDSLVRMINWIPEETDRIRLDLELSAPPYGYLVLYDAARGFILRLRRAPHVNLARPLEGLTITVDPGHPPGGAIGPTGYTEAQGVLAVGTKLRDILEQRGAHVVMTRTTMDAVDLHLRSVIARRANAHLLVSVHENAFGEGTDPFPNVGTSTLFFHPQSEPLARLAQAGMMREMGLRDLGIHYQNIAIGRTMWMPSIITEGLFLMVPEQENAAKDPAFQERYARGVADGIEAYFRSLAQR